MKTIKSFAIALLMGCTFIACEKADDNELTNKTVGIGV